MASASAKPIVLITGAAGNLGASVAKALQADYQIVGMDLKPRRAEFPIIPIDLGTDDSVELALRKFRDDHGSRIASVIHLIAYFDFSGTRSTSK
jgi:nucleoside-diphosphate-sugar epimerase